MIISGYNLSAVLEAILFASSQPVEISRLSAFLELPEGELLKALRELSEAMFNDDRGISLINLDKEKRWQLVTKLQFGIIVASFLENKRTALLSSAAMEVLAIAAYNQPVTKTFISQIRGVSSSEIVENLVEKGILKENGKLDLPGQPMSYITTDKFLTVFGLSSLDELPSQLKEDLNKFNKTDDGNT
jgi:segregation and condensation protein B